MPCTDWGNGPGPQYITDHESIRELKQVEAMLCAILSKARKSGTDYAVIDTIDEKKAGITKKQLLKWWENHLEEDRKRVAAEQAAERKKQLRLSALSKLTVEEKKSLGIK